MPAGAPKRCRFTPAAVAAGLAGSLALSLSLSGTLSGFVATITNTQNTVGSGRLSITETSGTSTCNSYDASTTCATINKYGGVATPLLPGGSQAVTVTFANTGSVSVGSLVLAAGTCVATASATPGSTTPTTPITSPGNLCSAIIVTLYNGASAIGTPLFSGSAAAVSGISGSLGGLAVGANHSYTIVASLPAAASASVQGQQISQPLVWTFNQ